MRYAGILGYVVGGVAAGAAAVYTVVYLYRWEWERALLSGVLLLVVEVFLATVAVLAQVDRLRRRLAESDRRAEEMLRHLAETRPRHAHGPEPFRWLRGTAAPRGPTGSGGGEPGAGAGRDTFVFVPVLVAAGAALSMLAILIQRLAAAGTRPGAERRLAGRLAGLAAPPGGILGAAATPAGEATTPPPPVPPARPLRAVGRVVSVLATAVLVALAVDLISDATQTRRQQPPASAATTVVFRVELRGVPNDRAAVTRAAQELWEHCHRSTSVLRTGTLGRLEGNVFSGVLRPPLPEHDLLRLRGCLRDTTANRALATVLGEGQATAPRSLQAVLTGCPYGLPRGRPALARTHPSICALHHMSSDKRLDVRAGG
ncbi:hypothetical protein ACTWP5_14670 [Streptomyces sp. 4N509B]|uniref:hypothetical protein n=1 Tax=Streptomyces sp. 4N509B TaxID=3457413 RepID=UPI003FD08D11